jgi:hypothetical protein
MIRFILIGNQIDDDDEQPGHHFAFFNTVNDLFITLDNEQVWQTWEEFEHSWREEYAEGNYDLPVVWPLERFKGLCSHYVSVRKVAS